MKTTTQTETRRSYNYAAMRWENITVNLAAERAYKSFLDDYAARTDCLPTLPQNEMLLAGDTKALQRADELRLAAYAA